jgi:hypothetical protein
MMTALSAAVRRELGLNAEKLRMGRPLFDRLLKWLVKYLWRRSALDWYRALPEKGFGRFARGAQNGFVGVRIVS